jgi:hypothetical protein
METIHLSALPSFASFPIDVHLQRLPHGSIGSHSALGSQILKQNKKKTAVLATGYGLDGPGSIPGRARFVFSPQRPDRLWGLPGLPSNGYRGGLSPGVKRPWRQADHSPLPRAEVKNSAAIPPLPHTSSCRSA